MKQQLGVQFTGVGKALPPVAVTNQQLAQVVDTSDEWIHTRTGIRERRILGLDQSILELALVASEQALAQAGLTPLDIDLLILATSTSDDLFGSASRLADRLGATRALAFDLTAACTGFIFAVTTAAQYLQSGVYQRALVVAADSLTRYLDWHDRGTCVLFGDGAGAMVMESCPETQLLGFELRSDGRGADLLSIAAQGEALALAENLKLTTHRYQYLTMNGREVYRFAVTGVPDVIEKALYRADLTAGEIDFYFLHQANQRILDAVADRLQVGREKFPSTLTRYANTSAASIPITLCEWFEQQLLADGAKLVMAGFGAGLTWGALVCRWGRVA